MGGQDPHRSSLSPPGLSIDNVQQQMLNKGKEVVVEGAKLDVRAVSTVAIKEDHEGEKDSKKDLPQTSAVSSPVPNIEPIHPTEGLPPVKLFEGGSSKGGWRTTRNHKARLADLHDNFLDTPWEEALNVLLRREQGTENEKVGESEGEKTSVEGSERVNNVRRALRDITVKNVQLPDRKKGKGAKMAPISGGIGDTKHALTRTKRHREDCKGVDCRGCKKFYNAVVPDGEKDCATKWEELIRLAPIIVT